MLVCENRSAAATKLLPPWGNFETYETPTAPFSLQRLLAESISTSQVERSWTNDYPDSFQLERQPALLQLKEFKFNYLLVLFLFVRFLISPTILKEISRICRNDDVTRRSFRLVRNCVIYLSYELPELHIHTHLPKNFSVILFSLSSTSWRTNYQHFPQISISSPPVKRCFT